MRKGIYSRWIVFIVVICFIFNVNSQHEKITSEEGTTFTDVNNSSSMSVTDFLLNSEEYSTFVKALKVTNSLSILEADGDFIVFAPNNDAFAHFPNEVLKQLFMAENLHKLKSIVDYHIVLSNINLEEELDKTDYKLYLRAVNGNALMVELGSEEVLSIVEANGFTIDVGSKIEVSNGAIYPIYEVLLPQVDVIVASR